MVTVIQYGLGNVGSILSMCKYIGVNARITESSEEIENATSLVLPGVGSFDEAMIFLANNKMIDILKYKVEEQKTPILGICLGMQLLTKGSEEGIMPGLSFIDAQCVRFDFKEDKMKFKVPHMGWNNLYPSENQLSLFPAINSELRYYFAHSYHIEYNSENVVATSEYGYRFVAAIKKDNIFGVQFHPEKSHQFGMKFLESYFKNHEK